MKIKGNLLYGQSGGPSSVINSSAYGVISQALKHSDAIDEIYCATYGIQGVIDDKLINVSSLAKEEIELLKQTPGAAFGSCRHKLTDFGGNDFEYQKILDVFKKHNIRFFLYNGGNDSMDTCSKIADFMKKEGYECYVIGIPKTIDNDLAFTDHTPGYGSAAKYIANTVLQIACDSSSYQLERINVVEIMGRHAGWLTAASSLASIHGYGPDLIYLPENLFDMKEFICKSSAIYKQKNSCLIAVSEGLRDLDGNFLSEKKEKDAFGHEQLGGTANYIASFLEGLGFKNRGICLSAPQRCASEMISAVDQKEAIMVGAQAVDLAISGTSGLMVTLQRTADSPYKAVCSSCALDDAANAEKKVPDNMYNQDTHQMTKAFYDYALPLIQGEIHPAFDDGIVCLAKVRP